MKATLFDIKIIDFFSQIGPALALIDLSETILISNIYFLTTKEQIYLPIKLILTWSALVNIKNLLAENFINNGFIDILYQSKVEIFEAKLKNFSCQSSEKGCIILLNANSLLKMRNSSIYNTRASKSFISVDHSTIDFEMIEWENNIIYGFSIDRYLMFADISNIALRNISGIDFSGGFSHFITSNVTIRKILIEKVQDYNTTVSGFFFEGCLYLTIEHGFFFNLVAERGAVSELFYSI